MSKDKNNFLKVYKKSKVQLSWEDFDAACEKSAKFLKGIDFTPENTSLLGIARGALPFLTKMSHLTEIRDISIVHAELTLSDKPHDRGQYASVVFNCIHQDKPNFILFEDIIHTGKSIKTSIDLLKSMNKNITAIISLVLTEDFIPESLECNDVPIVGIYQIPANGWIEFPWER